MLQGDCFFTSLEIRALTYGAEFAFSVTCGETGCRARIDWALDVRQLPVPPLSDASRAAFLDGNRFETKLPDAERRAWFRLLTGADERKLPAIMRNAGERILSAMLGFRCIETEGVEDKDKRRFLEDISMGDADFLLDEFDRVECGVETTLEVECAECFARRYVQLPLDRSLLPSGEGPDPVEAGPGRLFPSVDPDTWRESLFQLCWRQHGGSGLGMSMGEALDMTMADRDWFIESIGEQRSREAKEIERASKKR